MRRQERWRRAALWGLAAALLLGGGLLVRQLLSGAGVPQRRAFTTVLRVTLPPPLPPPPRPPEPPRPTEPAKVLEPAPPSAPKPTPQKAAAKPSALPSPPGNPLTAEAGPGANPYGLAVGDGSGNVIGGGGGGGGGSNRFGFYANLIESQVVVALKKDTATRNGRYRLVVQLWLDASGHVTRGSVVSSTGDPSTNDTILRILDGLAVGEAPPQGMPQPVRVRVEAQG